MINRRNLQIFGFQPLMRGKPFLLSIAGVIVLVALAGFFVFGKGTYRDSITSGAIITLPVEEGAAGAAVIGTDTSVDVLPEETPEDLTSPPEESTEEDRAFYEYGGQCASDIKKAEDDVLDVTTYLASYQQEYDTMNQDYASQKQRLEEELAALETRYQPDLERLQTKIGQSQTDLQRVQEALDAFKQACNF